MKTSQRITQNFSKGVRQPIKTCKKFMHCEQGYAVDRSQSGLKRQVFKRLIIYNFPFFQQLFHIDVICVLL